MIGSAYSQKLGIDTAAIPFGFKFRHSFFGSDHIVNYDDKVVLHEPVSILSSKSPKKQLNDFIKTINELARRHPDTRFVVDQVTMIDQTEENPLYSLVNNKNLVNSSYIKKSIINRFDDSVTAFATRLKVTTRLKASGLRAITIGLSSVLQDHTT